MQALQSPWPPELDALVASADHHRLLFENEEVRVLEVRIPAGAVTALHTHHWPATVYNLSWSDFIRYDDKGNIILQAKDSSAPASKTWWSDPIPPHTLKNSGKQEIHNICVEIKNHR